MQSRCDFEVRVGAEQIREFAESSGDFNPIHLEPEYARKTEFGKPIAHGVYLLGLVSRVLGMHIPGKRSIILSLTARFPAPLFYPDTVRVVGKLKSFDEAREAGTVSIDISSVNRCETLLQSEVRFGLHRDVDGVSHQIPAGHSEPLADPHTMEYRPRGRRRLLVTGGTGGLGAPVLSDLSDSFEVVCLTRSGRVNTPDIAYIQVDLEDEMALDAFLLETPPGFYGILHMSVAPVRRALITQDLAGLRRQWRHAVEIPVRLAQWAMQESSTIERIILVGSTAGTKHPDPHCGAYSLGKAGMEHIGRLLPVDLAVRRATVNVILPGFVPAGINRGVLERTQKSLAARTGTGRLVEAKDLVHVIRFLLSEESSQINGATITVDGGFFD